MIGIVLITHGNLAEELLSAVKFVLSEEPVVKMVGVSLDTKKEFDTFKKVIENAINPVLKKEGCPELKVKITAGYGKAIVILYSSDKSKAHIDIIGLLLNLAAKMQSVTKPNQIVIGEQIYNRLNSKLKTLFQRVDTDTTGWNYKILDGETYSVYACSPKVF